MDYEIVLNNLQKRSNSLRSQLIHEQLKSGSYMSRNFKKYQLVVLEEYKTHKSFFKVASILGISQMEIMDWYIQGQSGNPNFRGFFLAINEINGEVNQEEPDAEPVPVINAPECDEGEYLISQYGDGWSYKTYVDCEKIFIISNDLDTLKKKVRDKRLPLD